MSYTNLTTPEHQAEIAKLIDDLDKAIQAERDRKPCHDKVKAIFEKSSLENRTATVRLLVQETTAALILLRSMGITIADLAKIITTAK